VREPLGYNRPQAENPPEVAVSNSRVTAYVVLSCLALGAVACQSRDAFETCATTEKMKSDCKAAIAASQDQCTDNEVFCYDSCIVRDHPQCVEGPCVLYESRLVGETAPYDSGATSFCTVPCNGTACPADATCRAILSLKTACTVDADCANNGPWARCEAPRFCETSKAACETDADCAGQACKADDTAAKSCTWKFCVPATYAPGA
jgi:hypothetical protein